MRLSAVRPSASPVNRFAAKAKRNISSKFEGRPRTRTCGRADEVGVRPDGRPGTTPGECSAQMSNSHRIWCWTKSKGKEEGKARQHAQSWMSQTLCSRLFWINLSLKPRYGSGSPWYRSFPKLPELLIQYTVGIAQAVCTQYGRGLPSFFRQAQAETWLTGCQTQSAIGNMVNIVTILDNCHKKLQLLIIVT